MFINYQWLLLSKTFLMDCTLYVNLNAPCFQCNCSHNMLIWEKLSCVTIPVLIFCASLGMREAKLAVRAVLRSFIPTCTVVASHVLVKNLTVQ